MSSIATLPPKDLGLKNSLCSFPVALRCSQIRAKSSAKPAYAVPFQQYMSHSTNTHVIKTACETPPAHWCQPCVSPLRVTQIQPVCIYSLPLCNACSSTHMAQTAHMSHADQTAFFTQPKHTHVQLKTGVHPKQTTLSQTSKPPPKQHPACPEQNKCAFWNDTQPTTAAKHVTSKQHTYLIYILNDDIGFVSNWWRVHIAAVFTQPSSLGTHCIPVCHLFCTIII